MFSYSVSVPGRPAANHVYTGSFYGFAQTRDHDGNLLEPRRCGRAAWGGQTVPCQASCPLHQGKVTICIYIVLLD